MEFRRTIKSFVQRSRELSASHQRLFTDLWPQYELQLEQVGREIDNARWVLEIGYGDGGNLFQWAQALPEVNFLGVEVYRPGIAQLLKRLHKQPLPNLHLSDQDAVDLLAQLPPATLDLVLILFPDPWPKRRHHKRRLIQSKLIEMLSEKLKIGGSVRIATDWEDYAQQVQRQFCHSPDFVPGDLTRCPWGRRSIITRFEARGIREQRAIWELIWVRQA